MTKYNAQAPACYSQRPAKAKDQIVEVWLGAFGGTKPFGPQPGDTWVKARVTAKRRNGDVWATQVAGPYSAWVPVKQWRKVKELEFDGKTIDKDKDTKRLTTQMDRVYDLLSDGKARTLRDIADACGGSEAGVSARLRDLRKLKFQERYPNREVITERVEGRGGLHRYRLVL